MVSQLTAKAPAPGEPICGNCGYPLRDLVDSSKCPECGRPLVEVLMRAGAGNFGRPAVRYSSKAQIFGFPVISIATGARPEFNEPRGVARGLFAFGDIAFGGVAGGGVSVGIVSFGGAAFGLCTLGGLSLGIVTAMGGLAIGGVSLGGCAIGGIATGGGAGGYIAQGGKIYAVYGRGGGVTATHAIAPGQPPDPDAVAMFNTLSPFLGTASPASQLQLLRPLAWVAAFDAAIILICALIAVVALNRRSGEPDGQSPRQHSP